MHERANRSDAHQTLGLEPEQFCQCPIKIEIKSLSSISSLSFVYIRFLVSIVKWNK